jgi:hypothetical protein
MFLVQLTRSGNAITVRDLRQQQPVIRIDLITLHDYYALVGPLRPALAAFFGVRAVDLVVIDVDGNRVSV